MSSTSLPLQLDLDELQLHLGTQIIGRAVGWTNELWDCLESTNDRAAELAALGSAEGVIVLARQQLAGRGRQGRQWISPPDSGIYASFLLRPPGPRSSLPLYTLACGVACARAIQQSVGIKIGLKWVNDLIVDGRKIGGILAEIPGNMQTQIPTGTNVNSVALVLGIGINLRLDLQTMPEELVGKIDYLERLSGQPINPNLLVAYLAKNIEHIHTTLSAGRSHEIVQEWKQYSVTLGKEIIATVGNTTTSGTAMNLSSDGGLIIESTNGTRTILHAGEVTIRGADGQYV